MINLIRSKRDLVVDSDIYHVNISLLRGGTIRSLHFGDYNTMLTREGCEYWREGGFHYEQEYGKVKEIEIKELKKSIKINITASLRKPISGPVGGECSVKYIFEDTKIITESIVCPKFDMVGFDKYVCFKKDAFTGYSIDSVSESTTKNPDNQSEYYNISSIPFRSEFGDIDNIKLINRKNNFIIKSPDASMRLFKTRKMVEIKPEWNIEKINEPMIMEYHGK